MARQHFGLIDPNDPAIPPHLRPELERLINQLFELEQRLEALETGPAKRETHFQAIGPSALATPEQIAAARPMTLTINGEQVTILVVPEATAG